MINLIVDQVCEVQRYEIDCVPTPMPGQPAALMDAADEVFARHGTLVVSGSAAEDVTLRLLRRVREGVYKPEEVNICVRWAWQGVEKVNAMTVSEKGRVTENWPGGFFEHRLDEMF